MNDLRDIDFDDRDIGEWNFSPDGLIANSFLRTLMRFGLLKPNMCEPVGGTYFERKWRDDTRRESPTGRGTVLDS